MQSGQAKSKSWILEYERENLEKDFVMGWNSSGDTLKQIKISFDSKEQAINYATRNNISYDLIEPKIRKMILKSYADNFLK